MYPVLATVLVPMASYIIIGEQEGKCAILQRFASLSELVKQNHIAAASGGWLDNYTHSVADKQIRLPL